jgi:hypothetical protein
MTSMTENAMRYVSLGRTSGRWFLSTPTGEPLLSLGIVHADDTNLRYPHNYSIYLQRYGGQRSRWLREGLVPELLGYGFNTIGWTSEYVSGTGLGTTGNVVDLGHSDPIAGAELAGLGMPYTLSLRVAEIEHWNGYPAYRDPRDPAFAQWCDYLARTICRPDDENLLGYFLVDGPGWQGHPSGRGFPADELPAIAEAYYRVACEAIRRHDPHHLILGDRHGMRAGVPEPVLDALAGHVDVLSVQTFPGLDQDRIDAVAAVLDGYSARTGLPILIADTGNWCPTKLSPDRTGSAHSQAERGVGYRRLVTTFSGRPWCLGVHWCSWIENPHRGFGLKDPWDEPYADLTGEVSAVNAEVTAGIRELVGAAD